MKRTLLILVALLLSTLGSGQNQVIFPEPRSDLDFSRYVRSRAVEGTPIIGTNLTDGACFPDDPEDYVADLARLGYNDLRFHHIDRMLGDNWNLNFPKFHRFARAASRAGLRWSIDLYSKGHEHLEGNAEFKLRAYRRDAATLAYLRDYAIRLLLTPGPDGTRLVDDRNLWLICLINEGADALWRAYGALAAPMAQTFYRWGKSMLQSIGYDGLVGDLPDGAVDAKLFGPVVASQDICLMHIYGDDARDLWQNAYWSTYWTSQGWQWGSNLWFQGMTGRRGYVQEYGSLPYNPNRAVNSLFIASEISRNGFDSTSFAWNSNLVGRRGQEYWVDWTNIPTDLPRLVADRAAVAMAHFDSRQNQSCYWGHLEGQQSTNYDYDSTTVHVRIRGSYGYAVIIPRGYGTISNPRRALVFSLGPSDSVGLISSPLDFYRSVVIRHGLAYQSINSGGLMIDLPGRNQVATVKELDPYTSDVLSSRSQGSGTAFRPSRLVGISMLTFR